jgi:hypothetical protein
LRVSSWLHESSRGRSRITLLDTQQHLLPSSGSCKLGRPWFNGVKLCLSGGVGESENGLRVLSCCERMVGEWPSCFSCHFSEVTERQLCSCVESHTITCSLRPGFDLPQELTNLEPQLGFEGFTNVVSRLMHAGIDGLRQRRSAVIWRR